MNMFIEVFLTLTLMFGASFSFVALMWHLDDKRIDKELKEKYGKKEE